MRCLCLFALCLLTQLIHAQDVLVMRNGSRVNCRITYMDSSVIRYTRNGEPPEIKVDRSAVESYYIAASSPLKKKEDDYVKPVAAPAVINTKDIIDVSVVGGLALPLKDFASTDVYSDKSGLARKGRMLSASAVYKIEGLVGIGVGYHDQRHRFSDELIGNELRSQNPGFVISTNSSPWHISGVFGRICGYIPVIRKKLFVDPFFNAGHLRYDLPSLEIVASYGRLTQVINQSATQANAWTYMPGLEVEFRAAGSLSLKAGCSYLWGKPVFKNVITTNSLGGYVQGDYTQKVTALSLHVGIALIVTTPRNP